jgi:phage terminase large subunit-like protein
MDKDELIHFNHGIDTSCKESIKANQSYLLADQYAYDILTNKILSGDLIQKACEEYIRNRCDPDIKFIDYTACFFGFLEGTVFPDGSMKKYRQWLTPWMTFIVTSLYNFHITDPDTDETVRLYTQGFIMVGRGNGKTSLSSALPAFEMMMAPLGSCKTLSVGASQEGAAILGDYTKAMLSAPKVSTFISALFQCKANEIVSGDSNYKPYPARPDALEGIRLSLAIADEVHTYKTSEMLDVLTDSATGDGFGSLVLAITTAGDPNNPVAIELTERTRNKLHGITKDPRFFGLVYQMDKADIERLSDISVDIMIKANPNLGFSLRRSVMETLISEVNSSPIKRRTFLPKRCSIFYANSENTYADTLDISDCLTSEKLNIDDYLGEDCWLGFDGSQTLDLTTVSVLFKSKDTNASYDVFTFSFIPKKTVNNLPAKYRQMYLEYAEAGHLTILEEDKINQVTVATFIKSLNDKFNVKKFSYDLSGVHSLIEDLTNNCFSRPKDKMIEVSQGLAHINTPARELQQLIVNHKIRFSDPLFAWSLSNAITKYSGDGKLMRIEKENFQDKIDPVIATVCALYPITSIHQKKRSFNYSQI